MIRTDWSSSSILPLKAAISENLMRSPVQLVYRWYQSLLANPRYRGWVILGSLIYLVSPFDIAPDFFPLLGQIDDVVLLTLLLSGLFQWWMERINPQPQMDSQVERDASVRETSIGETNVKETIDVDAVSMD